MPKDVGDGIAGKDHFTKIYGLLWSCLGQGLGPGYGPNSRMQEPLATLSATKQPAQECALQLSANHYEADDLLVVPAIEKI